MMGQQKEPTNNDKFYWTEHAKAKLKQYGLSPQRVIRIINHPLRIEEAVAPNCVACLQRVGNKNKTELWVMYQFGGNKQQTIRTKNLRKIIISAWRYPGITEPGKPIPIPEDTLEEISALDKKMTIL